MNPTERIAIGAEGEATTTVGPEVTVRHSEGDSVS